VFHGCWRPISGRARRDGTLRPSTMTLIATSTCQVRRSPVADDGDPERGGVSSSRPAADRATVEVAGRVGGDGSSWGEICGQREGRAPLGAETGEDPGGCGSRTRRARRWDARKTAEDDMRGVTVGSVGGGGGEGHPPCHARAPESRMELWMAEHPALRRLPRGLDEQVQDAWTVKQLQISYMECLVPAASSACVGDLGEHDVTEEPWEGPRVLQGKQSSIGRT